MPISTSVSLALRSLLFLLAVTSVGLVSYLCLQLHDSFVKYALVSASVCLTLALNSLPLLCVAAQSLQLLYIVVGADIAVFALSLAAAIVMTREIRVVVLGRRIDILTRAHANAAFASVVFLWTLFATALATLLVTLHGIGRGVDPVEGCGNEAPCVKPLAESRQNSSEEKQPPLEASELFLHSPDAFVRAVAVPYV